MYSLSLSKEPILCADAERLRLRSECDELAHDDDASRNAKWPCIMVHCGVALSESQAHAILFICETLKIQYNQKSLVNLEVFMSNIL
jgi:hypothetical protein